ncbi:unnamed protein product [Rotaria sordida]|uniref:Uncharacterized protein n=2 Tax=Rotaria sordida TaxID=392033 RepID=A0A819DLD4_9BILA|nr:unnamed protein product [Rotaria sordida]CAF1408610.1 unnamed protein product [Rotaria sordida]CAF3837597.1 unnamed protein product [Rotaria sordida]CAF3950778.1 unnamed protein product [Rotaria sordida]
MVGFLDGNVKIRSPNSAILSSVQYFHLERITIDLLSLLAVAPMLHTLQGKFRTPDLKLDRLYPCLLHLQQLRIELWNITWTEMTTLLSSFPRLVYLTITADNVDSDMADGFAWARSLQDIKHFEFKLKFIYDAFEQQPLNLDSFRTKFWLEEKKWFVTYDQRLNADGSSLLYSNSSSLIIYPPHEIIGTLVSESTAPEGGLHMLCTNDIDALCHSFTNIERLDIHSSSITDLPQLLNRMKKTLTDIIIRQSRKVNNEQLITREWIERNTELENFHYTCDFWNAVRLWL